MKLQSKGKVLFYSPPNEAVELPVIGGCQCKTYLQIQERRDNLGRQAGGGLSGAVKPKDGPDAQAVRAGGTNSAMLLMVCVLLPSICFWPGLEARC